MASCPSTPAGAEGEPAATDVLGTSAAGPNAVRGGALRVGGYLLGTLVATASSALLFRHLGVVNTGRYTTALSLVAIVGGLSDLGLTAIGVRELSVRDTGRRAAIARNLLGMRIAFTAIGLLLVMGFAGLVGYGSVLVVGVLLAGVGTLAQSSQSTLAISLMVRLRLGWVALITMIGQLLATSLMVVLVVLGASLLPFLAISIPVGVVTFAITARLVRDDIPLRPAFVGTEWRTLIVKVLPYSAAVAASTLYFRLAIILVSVLATARQLGYFSASFRIVEVLVAVPGLLVGAAFPIFARAAQDDRTRLGYALGRVFDVSLIMGAWVALMLALASSVAIAVVGGPKFAPAAPLLAIQGVAVGAAFVGAVWANALLSLGRLRTILTFNVGAMVVAAVAVVIAVSLDGARGAATAMAFVETVAALIGARLLASADRTLLPSLGIVPKVAVATALAATPALVPGLWPGWRALAASAIYAAMLVALRALPPELHDLLHPRYRRPAQI